MGDHIDKGNEDFLNFGYGGERTLMVDKIGIPELKTYLLENNIKIRS
jgi:hypothetical protein